jgi:iron(III) transport system permease protein
VLRRPSLLSRGVDQLGTLPLVVPGVVLSLAVLRVFINSPIPVYNTAWIILIALVIHYLPWGLRFNHAGLITQHRELEEAADVSGASRLRVFLRILVPLILSGPNLNVVSSWIWSIWNNAALPQAATAAVVVILPVLVIAALFYRLTGAGNDSSASVGFR